VTDLKPAFGDPTTAPFWEAAERRELLIQRCSACGTHQFYPRPFCLSCGGGDVEWAPAAGTGTVHAATTVHMRVLPDLEPPYVVALVELDEGPRLVTNLVEPAPAIGDRVAVVWRERADAPPLPVFASIGADA
jgi:uncharacterized OB-fold protein